MDEISLAEASEKFQQLRGEVERIENYGDINRRCLKHEKWLAKLDNLYQRIEATIAKDDLSLDDEEGMENLLQKINTFYSGDEIEGIDQYILHDGKNIICQPNAAQDDVKTPQEARMAGVRQAQAELEPFIDNIKKVALDFAKNKDVKITQEMLWDAMIKVNPDVQRLSARVRREIWKSIPVLYRSTGGAPRKPPQTL